MIRFANGSIARKNIRMFRPPKVKRWWNQTTWSKSTNRNLRNVVAAEHASCVVLQCRFHAGKMQKLMTAWRFCPLQTRSIRFAFQTNWTRRCEHIGFGNRQCCPLTRRRSAWLRFQQRHVLDRMDQIVQVRVHIAVLALLVFNCRQNGRNRAEGGTIRKFFHRGTRFARFVQTIRITDQSFPDFSLHTLFSLSLFYLTCFFVCNT